MVVVFSRLPEFAGCRLKGRPSYKHPDARKGSYSSVEVRPYNRPPVFAGVRAEPSGSRAAKRAAARRPIEPRRQL